MKPRPYVCVTGLVNNTEVEETEKVFNRYFEETSSNFPAVGFLVSSKTLRGEEPKSSHIPNLRYPNIRTLRARMQRAGRMKTMVHYSTKEPESLDVQVAQIFGYLYREGENIYESNLCRMLQLNVAWPNPKLLEKIISRFPRMQIIQQLSARAMNGLTPEDITKKLLDYEDLISYVLIDPSGGRGVSLEIEKSLEIYKTISKGMRNVTLGFAGGLNGENVHDVVTSIGRALGHNLFCIDAEGGLRDVGEDVDDLNMRKTKKYISKSSVILYPGLFKTT